MKYASRKINLETSRCRKIFYWNSLSFIYMSINRISRQKSFLTTTWHWKHIWGIKQAKVSRIINNSRKSQNMFRLLCWRWLQGKTLPSRFGLFAQCRGGEVSKEQVSFKTGRCKLSFGQFEESFVSMCNDVLRLRAQLGGDWVVTFGLPTRSTLI